MGYHSRAIVPPHRPWCTRRRWSRQPWYPHADTRPRMTRLPLGREKQAVCVGVLGIGGPGRRRRSTAICVGNVKIGASLGVAVVGAVRGTGQAEFSNLARGEGERVLLVRETEAFWVEQRRPWAVEVLVNGDGRRASRLCCHVEIAACVIAEGRSISVRACATHQSITPPFHPPPGRQLTWPTLDRHQVAAAHRLFHVPLRNSLSMLRLL
eukprot:scaffold24565_cov27-Tisochrysis_lutea.AAC.2